MNEEELVYQLKQESQDAFNRIYNMYSARLYAYCMQYVKSREDTEEIVPVSYTHLTLPTIA